MLTKQRRFNQNEQRFIYNRPRRTFQRELEVVVKTANRKRNLYGKAKRDIGGDKRMVSKYNLKELLNTPVKFSQIYFVIIFWLGGMFTYLVNDKFLIGYFVFLFLSNLLFMLLNYMGNKRK
jgi:hypothetical protein